MGFACSDKFMRVMHTVCIDMHDPILLCKALLKAGLVHPSEACMRAAACMPQNPLPYAVGEVPRLTQKDLESTVLKTSATGIDWATPKRKFADSGMHACRKFLYRCGQCMQIMHRISSHFAMSSSHTPQVRTDAHKAKLRTYM